MHSNGREMKSILLVVIGLLFIELLVRFGLDIGTMAPAFVVLVYAAYSGGLRAGLVAATIISAYDLWRLWPDDVSRAVIVGTSCFGVAVMVGLLQRKAVLVDTLNGNIARLKQAIEYLDSLLGGWYAMNDPERRDRVRIVREHLSTLATLVVGWRRLAEAKEKALAGEENES